MSKRRPRASSAAASCQHCWWEQWTTDGEKAVDGVVRSARRHAEEKDHEVHVQEGIIFTGREKEA